MKINAIGTMENNFRIVCGQCHFLAARNVTIGTITFESMTHMSKGPDHLNANQREMGCSMELVVTVRSTP